MWLGTCAVGCQQETNVEPFDFTGTGADADTESEVADTSDATWPDASGPQCRRDSDTAVADTSHSDAGCHHSWVDFEGERNCCRDVDYKCGNFNFGNLAEMLPKPHYYPSRDVFHIGYFWSWIKIVDATLSVRVSNRRDQSHYDHTEVSGTRVIAQGDPAFEFDLSGIDPGRDGKISLTGLEYTDACGVTTKLDIQQTIQDGQLTGEQFWECERQWSCILESN
jgi:hypothetical protein